jgi:uncharacterized protein
LHFDRIKLDKVPRLLRPMMLQGAKLLRASLIFGAIGGAATAAPLEDAVVAYQRGDYTTALRAWHPLAEQGDAEAQFHLGVMYESGQGVLRNHAEASKWYRKAAEQGDAVAQFNLAIMYAKGDGVSQNDTEAAQWYRLAADQGLGGAQFNLAIMYTEGKGVPQDHVLAHMWLDIVVSELPPLGKNQRNSTVDALHLVASKMRMAQLAEARQLAFEWMIERRHRTQQKNLAATLR